MNPHMYSALLLTYTCIGIALTISGLTDAFGVVKTYVWGIRPGWMVIVGFGGPYLFLWFGVIAIRTALREWERALYGSMAYHELPAARLEWMKRLIADGHDAQAEFLYLHAAGQ